MLSDIVFEAYAELKVGYLYYKEPPYNYHKEILDETEEILERLDALRFKLDAAFYAGSYKFDDDGALQKYKLALLQFTKEIYELAGDLSTLDGHEQELYESKELNKWATAMRKLELEGKEQLVDELRIKWFNQQ